ncbi:MAG: triosephosphate isomerase [Desulfomicrobiaceae bacterium]|jgi:triosephosphate isomerase|nr:triosephosphate isomerase [Desulfomicrobiaceae bacterium]MBZ4685012.1 triosephosphate isomerase [Desulfomicrobiaceae bacterium]MDK2873940.1 triosephosphate isomerase [Desulfomicrobiaceae bacterium]
MPKLIAANWKMYKTLAEAETTARELAATLAGRIPADREVLVCPAFVHLPALARTLQSADIRLGAQDLYPAEEGAFTGEVAPRQLMDVGCSYALVGHSERRHVLGEKDAFVAQKTAFGLAAGLHIILCVGETLEERRAGQLEAVLTRQITSAVTDIPQDGAARLTIAYEPVWAIGTGEVATLEDIDAAHAVVRRLLEETLGEAGRSVRILYGGSVKPDNAGAILGLDNVDGVLVGGASLEASSFSKIVLA